MSNSSKCCSRRSGKFINRNIWFWTQPHIIIRDVEPGDKPRFVEIFSWASHSSPEHVPDAVKQIWGTEQTLCEPRNGHTDIEGGEVELVVLPGHERRNMN